MPNRKITDLPSSNTVTGTERVLIVQDGSTKSASADTLISKALRSSRATARLDKIMRAARAARTANPRNAGLYAGTVTVIDRGATAPVETPNLYPFSDTATGVWRTTGGQPTLVNGTYRFCAAIIGATGGTVGTGNGKNATYWRSSVVADSRYVTFRVNPSTIAYRILVDGQYVSLSGLQLATTTGTTLQHILVDFGTRGLRTVTLEAQFAQGFAGGYSEATASLWRPDVSDTPYVAMLGDSYVVGAGPTMAADGPALVMGDWLGARLLASGSGGTGWGTPTAYRFDERILGGDLALSDSTPDLIVLMASINDRNRDQAMVQSNAITGITAVRAQYPDTPIVVMGALAGATGPSTTAGNSLIAAEQSVAAAVATFASDPLIAFVPISTDANGAWISGTGKIGTTTGTGNSDWATVSDGIHASEEGAAMIGRRYATSILAALRTMSQAII